MVSSPAAQAASVPSHYCPLTRSPELSWLRLVGGDDCARDEDGNGLDDEIESEIATCFVPEVVFDSRENALRVDEPHVLFSSQALGPNRVRLRFAFLFARDGGYVLGTEFPCTSGEHDGDVDSVVVDVAWTERDRRWFGAPLAMRIRDTSDVEIVSSVGGAPHPLALSGTHPIVYATAGKHHWVREPVSLVQGCDCGPVGHCGSVRDRADGAGPRVTPPFVRHAPLFYRPVSPDESPVAGSSSSAVSGAAIYGSRVRSHSPLDEQGRGFLNACELRRGGGVPRPSTSLASNDLGEIGYPGERIWGSCFRGGFGGLCAETISVAEKLAWPKPASTAAGSKKLVSVLLSPRTVASSPERPPLLRGPAAALDGRGIVSE